MMGVRHIKEVRMLRQEGHPIRDISRKKGISRNLKNIWGPQLDAIRTYFEMTTN